MRYALFLLALVCFLGCSNDEGNDHVAARIKELKKQFRLTPADEEIGFQLAALHRWLGDSSNADQVLDQLEDIQPGARFRFEIRVTDILIVNGNFEAAKKRALQSLEAIPRDRLQLRAQVFQQLAESQISLGEYSYARESLEEALRLLHRSRFPAERAWILQRMADLCRVSGEYAESRRYASSCLRLREATLPRDDPQIGDGILAVAEAFVWSRMFKQAEPHVERAVKFFAGKNGENARAGLAVAILFEGQIQLRKGRLSDGQKLLRRALAEFRSLGLVNRELEAEIYLAQVEVKLGNGVEAERKLRRLKSTLTKKFGGSQVHTVGLDVYLGQSLRLQGRYDEAADILYSALKALDSRIGREEQGIAKLTRARVAFSDRLLVELTTTEILRGRPAAALAVAEGFRTLDFRAARSPSVLPLNSVAKCLAPDEIFVSIQNNDDTINLLIVRPKQEGVVGFVLSENSTHTMQVNNDVRDWERAIRMVGSEEDVRERVKKHFCPEHVRRQLRDARRILLVADAPYANIPLGLVFPVEQASYLPSGNSLVNRRLSELTHDSRTPMNLLLVCKWTYDDWNTFAEETGQAAFERDAALQPSDLPLPSLPHVEQECGQIEAIAKTAGVQVVSQYEEHASIHQTLKQFKGKEYLHLSMHGFEGFNDAPGLARLVLSRDKCAAATHMLTLEKIESQGDNLLAGCKLVVLDGCKTDFDLQVGSSSLSLAKGFLEAGARSVLATQWRTDDRAARLIACRFYQNLWGTYNDTRGAEDGEYAAGTQMSPADALLEAQRYMQEQVNVANEDGSELFDFSHPYFWAGYTILGAPN